jgi:hypothetical protein
MWASGAGEVVLAASYEPRLLINSLYLAGSVLLLAAVVAVLSRWRRRYGSERLTPGDQLSHFRSLYEKGAISAEEFARLRTLLTGQVHEATAGKKPPAGITPEPSSTPPANGQGPPQEGIQPG